MVATSVRKIVAYQFIVPLHAKYRVDPLKTISPLRCNVGLIKIGSFFLPHENFKLPNLRNLGETSFISTLSLKLIVRNIPKSYRRYRASLLKTFYSLTLFFFAEMAPHGCKTPKYYYIYTDTTQLLNSLRQYVKTQDRLV